MLGPVPQLPSWDPWASAARWSRCTVPQRTCGAWGGVGCVCPWAVGSVWAPCQVGDEGSPPLPRHLLPSCLRSPSPFSAAARACGRGARGSWLRCRCHLGARPRCGRCRVPPPGRPKPQAPSPAAGGAASLPAPSQVKGQSEASREGPLRSQRVEWEPSFPLRFAEHALHARPRAQCLES